MTSTTYATIALDEGASASFRWLGEGALVFLVIPGGPGMPAETMSGEAELLTRWGRAILIDPPGLGQSTPATNDEELTPLGHARWYRRVLDALEVDKVHLVGASFGGLVAVEFAAEYPNQSLSCVGLSTPIKGSNVDTTAEETEALERALGRHADAPWYAHAREVFDNWTEMVLAADDASIVEEMNRTIMPLYCAEPDQPLVRKGLEDLDAKTYIDLRVMKVWESGLFQYGDVRPSMQRITCATLFVCGELDWMTGQYGHDNIREAMPTCDCYLLPDSGHLLLLEARENLTVLLASWYKLQGISVSKAES